MRKASNEVKDPSLTFLGVEEIVKNNRGERDMVEMEDHHNSAEESEEVQS